MNSESPDPRSSADVPLKKTPKRSHIMSPSVKSFLLSGHSNDEITDITGKIAKAEEAGETRYIIQYRGGWYQIEFGQIIGSGKGERR